jgi:hypothetical protein
MAPSKPSLLSRSELKDILNVYRLCFEAAIDAFRAPSVTAFSQHPDHDNFWRVYGDAATSGHMPKGTHQELLDAYRKWNMCDDFCVMVFGALRKHLKSMYSKHCIGIWRFPNKIC